MPGDRGPHPRFDRRRCIDSVRAAAGELRVAYASGVLQVAATVHLSGGEVVADEAVVYRTARRLMQGEVLIP